MSTTVEDLKRRLAGAPSADELRARLGAKPEPSATAVGANMAGRKVLNSILALPSASGDVLAAASAGLQHINPSTPFWRLADKLRGIAPEERPTFGERYAEEQQKFPANALRAIPRPTVNDIGAAIRSAPALMPGGETPSEAFERNREDLDEQEFALRDAHPTAAKVGDVVGDVGTLLLARRPTGIARGVQRLEARMGAREAAKATTSLMGDLEGVITSKPFRMFARGAGRSVESGLEAAVLDIVNDPNADPIETAAIAAGGQMVGSGFIGGAQGILSGGPTKAGIKLSLAAAAVFGTVQVLKSATPGGRDRVLESIETGYDKVALGLGLGAASAALAATRYGRGNTALSDQTRSFLDGIGTVHRGTVLSLLNDYRDGDENTRANIERVMTEVASDPNYRGKTAEERRIVSRLRNQYRTGGQF